MGGNKIREKKGSSESVNHEGEEAQKVREKEGRRWAATVVVVVVAAKVVLVVVAVMAGGGD